MSIVDLVRQWEDTASVQMAAREYRVRLPLRDAAGIAALLEMYPRRSETELISELLTAALDELERAMPYVQGNRVTAEDEQGDPVYEDVGPTPRFIALRQKYLRELEEAASR